jgi:S1-C subfamily serine protease
MSQDHKTTAETPRGDSTPGERSSNLLQALLGPAWRRYVAGLLFGLLFVLLAIFAIVLVRPAKQVSSQSAGDANSTGSLDPLEFARQLSHASQKLSQRVGRAVVRIDAEQIVADKSADTEIAQLFGSAPPAFGQGSGVIVQADGYVLTNYHVIRGARQIHVVNYQKNRYTAEVVGTDALTDLAVLKIDARSLDTLPWGDSDALDVGALVWAVGSPFGLEGSVSFGILSAKNRSELSDSPFQEFLQTDAAVNPGNSGGPLIDASGSMIGINTAILGAQFQGISFAIPSNLARSVYQRLKEQGHFARGWLGVGLESVTAQRAAQLNLPSPRGAYVVSVAEGSASPSPAQLAGLRPGDVVTQWNGHLVDDPIRLSRMVAQSRIGSQARVTLIRQGQEMRLSIRVAERPR